MRVLEVVMADADLFRSEPYCKCKTEASENPRLSPPGASRCLPNRPSRPIWETGSDVRYRLGQSDGKQTSASPLREVRHEPETEPKDASKKHSSPSPNLGAAQAASASSGGPRRSRRSRPGQSSGRHTTWLESSGIAEHVPLRLSPSRPVNEHGSPTLVSAHAASASSGGPSPRRLPGRPSPKLDAALLHDSGQP